MRENPSPLRSHYDDYFELVQHHALVVRCGDQGVSVVISREEYEHSLDDAYWLAQAEAIRQEARGLSDYEITERLTALFGKAN